MTGVSLADLKALAEQWIEAAQSDGDRLIGPRYGTIDDQFTLAQGVLALVAVAQAAQEGTESTGRCVLCGLSGDHLAGCALAALGGER